MISQRPKKHHRESFNRTQELTSLLEIAKDTRLGREVALKILPGSFSTEPDRLRRFASSTGIRT